MKRRGLIVTFVLIITITVLTVTLIPEIKKQIYPREFSEAVSKYATEFNVPEPLVYAVINAESSFNPEAKSHVGAIGLMQLMPDTLDWLSRLMDEPEPTGDIHDPETNIKYGTYYLSHLYKRFGSWETALAAYNAGHGRVGSWLEDARYSEDGQNLKNIPIKETENYVNKVIALRDKYQELYY